MDTPSDWKEYYYSQWNGYTVKEVDGETAEYEAIDPDGEAFTECCSIETAKRYCMEHHGRRKSVPSLNQLKMVFEPCQWFHDNYRVEVLAGPWPKSIWTARFRGKLIGMLDPLTGVVTENFDSKERAIAACNMVKARYTPFHYDEFVRDGEIAFRATFDVLECGTIYYRDGWKYSRDEYAEASEAGSLKHAKQMLEAKFRDDHPELFPPEMKMLLDRVEFDSWWGQNDRTDR